MSKHRLTHGRGTGNRRHHTPTAPTSHAAGAKLPVQSTHFVAPHFPFQPLPTPNGPAPYRFDLSHLLHTEDVQRITESGSLVFHTVGDTGDERGKQMDFVSAMMTEDYDAQPEGKAPAFFYHLGDVVYFAGDIDMYGENFYETYNEYPGLIVAIPGNHDCQPDDPQDGPVDPNKVPLDGWVQNFMSKDPSKLGSLKTSSSRTQMDLPNVYWTFTTPFATIIGLFSNVSETEAELHPDQIAWFKGELTAADPNLALIVAIHHPPFSGDTEHSGSSVAEKVLFESFAATGRYPHLILSGHVHNYQRFTVKQASPKGHIEIPCVVAGAGGYTKLGKLHKVHSEYPTVPLEVSDTLTLEQYDQDNFGFLRLEVSKTAITGIYFSAPYEETKTPPLTETDRFTIDVDARTVTTTSG
ncbi:metallophosphoesterase [Acidisphaera sp. S103]|uniref:metallophosphoesterase family protein n=1 Tax=Acidisphaera sp. S103 TaxID=1747223 RepID=UPI00131B7B2C|nr:metallophosphoesterase [Acidisphaera sp. S103]